MKALLVVAHPDDETIFLGGFIRKNNAWEWTIVSVTHSPDSERGREFREACGRLRARPHLLGHPDRFEDPLDEDRLRREIEALDPQRFDLIITHNAEGEYGHPHHISVSRVVRAVCRDVYRFGYNLPHDVSIHLNAWELEEKRRIIREVYASQAKVWALKLFDLSRESLISPGYEALSFNDAFLGRNDFWNYRTDAYELERHRRIVDSLSALRPQKILEVGCHEGALTEKLQEIAPVTGLDISEEALRRARRSLPATEFVQLDAQHVASSGELAKRTREGEFDVVLLCEVVYYFEDFRSSLEPFLSGPRYLVTQHGSRFHKRLEEHLVERGAFVVESVRSNAFGLGVYRLKAAASAEQPSGDAT